LEGLGLGLIVFPVHRLVDMRRRYVFEILVHQLAPVKTALDSLL
jgi:hypothetical protein